MAWMKIDEKVRSHPKIVPVIREAGGGAGWFWLCGIAYAREHSTDGFLADAILPDIAPGLKAWKKLPEALAGARLWVRVDGGYQIRDFHDWNPSKAEMDSARQEDRDRKAAAREAARVAREAARAARPDGRPESVRDVSERTGSTRPYAGADAGAFSPSPSGSGAASSSGFSEGGPGETAAVARVTVSDRAGALGIVRPGVWDRQHSSHAFRGDFCGWVCLPQSVVDGFVGRAVHAGSSPDVAQAAVRAWALDVKALWTREGRIPGDDIFAFWRNEWAATHGTNRQPSTPASTDALAGFREAERRG